MTWILWRSRELFWADWGWRIDRSGVTTWSTPAANTGRGRKKRRSSKPPASGTDHDDEKPGGVPS